MSRPTSSSSSSSIGSWAPSPQFQGWNHQHFDLEYFKYIFGQQEECITKMQLNNNQVVEENYALKWKIQQLEIQNQQLQAAQAGLPMSPSSAESARRADKERIRMLEEENGRLKKKLEVYQLNPENLDLFSFLYNESRDVTGHPKIVQLTTRTEHFYNIYKNRAIPPFQTLDKEEKKKWSKVWKKMRDDQKDQVARDLIQYVKKEVIELD
ncbi:hypothetical protein CAEBREN_23011 [Caenorhabditis brenneri]|uniref:Uncharacterized protein n=1 Tax=Caenorhabditis brenneri TaxID=135651 RepID=G0MDE3_CAEBE|nr:hypothetical protein CAEBREN_23011 [Caenorhabditis brenneri]